MHEILLHSIMEHKAPSSCWFLTVLWLWVSIEGSGSTRKRKVEHYWNLNTTQTAHVRKMFALSPCSAAVRGNLKFFSFPKKYACIATSILAMSQELLSFLAGNIVNKLGCYYILHLLLHYMICPSKSFCAYCERFLYLRMKTTYCSQKILSVASNLDISLHFLGIFKSNVSC